MDHYVLRKSGGPFAEGIKVSRKEVETLMTMGDLVNTVAAKTGVTKSDMKLMLDAMVKAICDVLANGGSVRLPALGYFKVGVVTAHDAENALIGGVVHFDEQKRVRFKPGKELRDRLNH